MKKTIFGLMIAALAITACTAPKPSATATPIPTATATLAPTATPVPPTATPQPTATPLPPTATPIPPDTTELSAQLMAALYPDGIPAAGDISASVQGVEVVPLDVPAGSQPLWAAYSVGRNGYLPEEPRHFVAIFSHGNNDWQQLASLELTDPDYLGAQGFQQIFRTYAGSIAMDGLRN